METILARIEAEITLGIFVYGNYFPDSKKSELFDEWDKKVEAARKGGPELKDSIPTLVEFAEIWLSEKRVEWRDSYIKSKIFTPITPHAFLLACAQVKLMACSGSM